jgi:uncharacterized membrane protein
MAWNLRPLPTLALPSVTIDNPPMTKSYNHLAGQSVERVAALSDGIFGVAMTLLLLELHVPLREAVADETALVHALVAMLPQVLVYLMSFMTLGIFWVGQQTQLSNLSRSDRHLTWIHLAFLFLVTILPFSTRLLAEFITFRTALVVYWLNLVLLGGLLFACWRRAACAGLVVPELTVDDSTHIERRIIFAQGLYAVGAALCVISTFASIGFIVLVQLNYAVAPRWRKAGEKVA